MYQEGSINLQKIEVLLADDNREFTNLLSEVIDDQEDMSVVGVAYNGNEVFRFIEQQRKAPDILILDIIMPHLDGLGVLEKLREMNLPNPPKIIMLTAFFDFFLIGLIFDNLSCEYISFPSLILSNHIIKVFPFFKFKVIFSSVKVKLHVVSHRQISA